MSSLSASRPHGDVVIGELLAKWLWTNICYWPLLAAGAGITLVDSVVMPGPST